MDNLNIVLPILQRLCNLERRSSSGGNSFICGSGAPNANAGNINDIYLDLETVNFYSKTQIGWKFIGTPTNVIDGGTF